MDRVVLIVLDSIFCEFVLLHFFVDQFESFRNIFCRFISDSRVAFGIFNYSIATFKIFAANFPIFDAYYQFQLT